MKKAITVFHGQTQGVLNIIRAADIYTIHILAKLRATEPDKDFIDRILEGNRISGYNVSPMFYTESGLAQLREGAHLREVGQQIIVATYTLLESYLISKFKEYYSFHMAGVNPKIVDESLRRIGFRSLEDIKRNFHDILDIHLPSFDIQFSSAEDCSFHAKDSWDAIKVLSKVRNEIVHQGISKSYAVRTLMDSWYQFDFTRRWVDLFDANFDSLIYANHDTHLIKEYKKRKGQQ